MTARPMTPKQQRFVEEYLIDLNATQAAIRAGYSARTADVQGGQLLRKTSVQAAIAEQRRKISERVEISAAFVLEGLYKNYHRAMQEEEVLDRDGNPTGEFRYEGSVANRALELLGKHLGLFVEKVEHTGKDGGPLAVEDVSMLSPVEREQRLLAVQQALVGMSKPATPSGNGYTNPGNGTGHGNGNA